MNVVAAAFLIGALAGGPIASRPPALPEMAPPELTAAAWLLYDVGTGTVLSEHNANERRSMASVTKLMTAMVALDHAEGNEIVVISASAASTGEAEVGLVEGESWSVRELLSAMLVRSGNDAAVAVAEHVGGSIEGFAAMMNAKARELGMFDTSFANPHGLDADGHYTTAYDLLTLTQAVLDDPLLARLVRTRVVKFRPDPNGKERRAVNTNALLGAYPGVDGVKTGYTNQAGRVLISAADRGTRSLIAIVMGSEDHFGDSRALLEYGFHAFGPGDVLLAPLGGEQGGGGTVTRRLPAWLTTRLAAVPPLDDGLWAVTPPGSTPAARAVTDRLTELLPSFLGTQS